MSVITKHAEPLVDAAQPARLLLCEIAQNGAQSESITGRYYARLRDCSVNDSFRLDLADYDKDYILSVIRGFYERAADHRRCMVEIRMSEEMLAKLAIEPDDGAFFFRHVPIIVRDTGLEDTIELILGPQH